MSGSVVGLRRHRGVRSRQGGRDGEKCKAEGSFAQVNKMLFKKEHFKGINVLLLAVSKPLVKSQSFIKIYYTFVHFTIS